MLDFCKCSHHFRVYPLELTMGDNAYLSTENDFESVRKLVC
jgi:hypothetical protein